MQVSSLPQIALGILAVVTLLGIVLRYPQVAYVLFLTAGMYKADPRFALPSGIDLTVVMMLVTIGAIAIRSLTVDALRIPRLPGSIWLPHLLLCGLVIVSLFYTPAPIYGLDKALRYTVFVSVALIAPFMILRQIRDFRVLLLAFIAVALVVVFDVITSGSLGQRGNLDAFGSTYLMLGRIMGLALMAVVVYFMTSRKRVSPSSGPRIIWLGIAIVFCAVLLLSAGRGPMLAVIIALVAACVLAIRLRFPTLYVRNRSVLLIALFLAVVGILLLTLNPGQVFDTSVARIQSLISMQDNSAGARVSLYEIAYDAFIESPIFGKGIGGFSTYAEGTDRRLYPHNIFLEFASELGLAGVLLFSWLLASSQYHLLRALRSGGTYEMKRILITAAAILWLTLVNAMVTGDITDNRIVFAAIGICVAMSEVIRRKAQNDSRRRRSELGPTVTYAATT